MRIAFVHDIIQFAVPLGTTLVAGNLRHGGHEVDVFVVANDLDKTIRELKQYKPDAVAFSVITGSHQEYIVIARKIKQKLNIPIIWGGPHATFFPKIIEEDYADVVCVGEGEEAALEFANSFDALGGKIPTDIKNLWVKVDGKIYRNTVRPRIKNLDELPYPARDLFFNKFPIMKNHGMKHFLAHRGCPHKSTYCFNHSYNKMYREQAGDKKVLYSRSPDSIVDEILWLKKSETIKTVHFVDDVFTVDKKWTLKFADIYFVTESGGLVTCLDAHSGEKRWVERLGGNYSASPTFANGKIYFHSREGETTVLQAGKEFKVLAKNKLNGQHMASAAVDGDALILRTDKALYRIEQK